MRFNLLQEEHVREGKCLYMEVVYYNNIKYDYDYIKYITKLVQQYLFCPSLKAFQFQISHLLSKDDCSQTHHWLTAKVTATQYDSS